MYRENIKLTKDYIKNDLKFTEEQVNMIQLIAMNDILKEKLEKAEKRLEEYKSFMDETFAKFSKILEANND